MRYNYKSVLVAVLVVFMLLEGILLHVHLDLKRHSSSSSSSKSVFFKVWKFNYNYSEGNGRRLKHRRFGNHGFRTRNHYHLTDEEQKRITPNGANPLHNRWSSSTSLISKLCATSYLGCPKYVQLHIWGSSILRSSFGQLLVILKWMSFFLATCL